MEGERKLFERLGQDFARPFDMCAAPVNFDRRRVLRHQDVFLQALDAPVRVQFLVAVNALGRGRGDFDYQARLSPKVRIAAGRVARHDNIWVIVKRLFNLDFHVGHERLALVVHEMFVQARCDV